jgi:hypothetical protein
MEVTVIDRGDEDNYKSADTDLIRSVADALKREWDLDDVLITKVQDFIRDV